MTYFRAALTGTYCQTRALSVKSDAHSPREPKGKGLRRSGGPVDKIPDTSPVFDLEDEDGGSRVLISPSYLLPPFVR